MATETFNASDTWECPDWVTSVVAECWGPGGGGADGEAAGTAPGGGGGAYASKTVAVTPLDSYDVVVGLGGAGGIADDGADGSVGSSFDSIATVLAAPGSGGVIGGAGTGGTTAASVGDVKRAGGNGGSGFALGGGGGGGSSPGPAAAGVNGSNGTITLGGAGGVPPAGGAAGGHGESVALGDLTDGVAPGGGGGGSAFGGSTGADGADGRVTLTYTVDRPAAETGIRERSTVAIDAAALLGNNILVAARSGVVIRVITLMLVADGAVAARFKSGASTNLTGAFNLIAGRPFTEEMPYPDGSLFETAPSESLVLNLSDTVAVNGFAVIEQVSQT